MRLATGKRLLLPILIAAELALLTLAGTVQGRLIGDVLEKRHALSAEQAAPPLPQLLFKGDGPVQRGQSGTLSLQLDNQGLPSTSLHLVLENSSPEAVELTTVTSIDPICSQTLQFHTVGSRLDIRCQLQGSKDQLSQPLSIGYLARTAGSAIVRVIRSESEISSSRLSSRPFAPDAVLLVSS